MSIHSQKQILTFSPKQPIEGIDEVLFNNNSSGDSSLSYNWYFNDSKGSSSSGKNETYLYMQPGQCPVVLVSTNQ